MLELLLKLEMSLWIEETRNNPAYLNNILHTDFLEFGKSGKVYNKLDIINDNNCVINAVFPFKDLKIKNFGDKTYLITYVAMTKNGNEISKSNRSSIWIGDNKIIQMVFHQGTIVPE